MPPPITTMSRPTRNRSFVQTSKPIPNALATLAPAMILVRSDMFHSVNRNSTIDISNNPTPRADQR